MNLADYFIEHPTAKWWGVRFHGDRFYNLARISENYPIVEYLSYFVSLRNLCSLNYSYVSITRTTYDQWQNSLSRHFSPESHSWSLQALDI